MKFVASVQGRRGEKGYSSEGPCGSEGCAARSEGLGPEARIAGLVRVLRPETRLLLKMLSKAKPTTRLGSAKGCRKWPKAKPTQASEAKEPIS